MAMVHCRGCGKEIHESAPTCPHCGAPQSVTSAGVRSNVPDSKGFMEYAMTPMRKFAEFSGRSRRKEYWFFFLGYFMVLFALGFISAFAPSVGGIMSGLFYLAIIIPSIACGVRRMHDTDHSGWWLIVPIVNLVFACSEGTAGPNRFGPDPKGI